MTSDDEATEDEAVDLEELRRRLFGPSNTEDPPPPTDDLAAAARQLFTPNPRSRRI